MMVGKYILSIDQGTTSSRAVLFDAFGGVAGMGQREFPQIYPQPGYVEHDAVQILQTTLYAMRQAVEQAGIRARDIAAISITNQRETTVAWDAVTGIPVCKRHCCGSAAAPPRSASACAPPAWSGTSRTPLGFSSTPTSPAPR